MGRNKTISINAENLKRNQTKIKLFMTQQKQLQGKVTVKLIRKCWSHEFIQLIIYSKKSFDKVFH